MDPATPIPVGNPLPLPVPPGLLVALHVIFFAMHILFVNLMLGGAILTLYYEIKGRVRADYDALAHEIAKTVTVNKSLAVVMGVGPLLIINLLYTTHFYSATTLIGHTWILIVPLVIVAFLLAYLHKYSWERMQQHKSLHILMIAVVVAILLSIPLIFLTTINLMLFPDQWLKIRGFVDALLLPNVLPRYLHFLLASLSVIGLFLVKWTTRPAFPAEALFTDLHRGELRKQFYTLAFGATAIQFIAGPLVLVTLPSQGMNIRTLGAVACGIAFAIPALVWMWKELNDPSPVGAGRRYWHIIGAISMTVMFMVIGRHLYRVEAVADHEALIAVKTQDYIKRRDDANKGIFAVVPVSPVFGTGSAALDPVPSVDATPDPFLSPKRKDPRFAKGSVTVKACQACHQPSTNLIAPSEIELSVLFKDDLKAIALWAKAPYAPTTRKRNHEKAQYPLKMTPQPYTDDALEAAGFVMCVQGEEAAARKAAEGAPKK